MLHSTCIHANAQKQNELGTSSFQGAASEKRTIRTVCTYFAYDAKYFQDPKGTSTSTDTHCSVPRRCSRGPSIVITYLRILSLRGIGSSEFCPAEFDKTGLRL